MTVMILEHVLWIWMMHNVSLTAWPTITWTNFTVHEPYCVWKEFLWRTITMVIKADEVFVTPPRLIAPVEFNEGITFREIFKFVILI